MATNSVFDPEQYNKLRKALESSPTAYSSGARASQSDINNQIALQKLEQAKEQQESAALQERWYGPRTTNIADKTDRQEGYISKLVHTLSAPLYGIVGAVETATGQGSKKGLFSNIAQNIKERETFGDVLRRGGMPTVAAMPIGFALDVALDPVSWATLGTTAAVPRLAYGVGKAGIKGGTKALESTALRKASTVAGMIPGVKSTSAYKNLAEKAVKSMGEYDVAVGRGAEYIPGKALTFGGKRLGEHIIDASENKPWLQQTINFFGLRNKKAIDDIKAIDDLEKSQKAAGTFVGSGGEAIDYANMMLGNPEGLKLSELMNTAKGLSGKIPETFNEAVEIIQRNSAPLKSLFGQAEDALGVTASIPDKIRWVNSKIDEYGAEVALGVKKLGGTSHEDVMKLLATEKEVGDMQKATRNAIVDLLEQQSGTGVKWIDDVVKKAANLKIGNIDIGLKMLDGYNKYLNTFKIAKVALSPVAWTNALFGNNIMGTMMGLQMWRSEYRDSILESWKFLRGKNRAQYLDKIAKDPVWQKFFDESPHLFEYVFGINPKLLWGEESEILKRLSSNYKGPLPTKEELDLTLEALNKIGKPGSIMRPARNVLEASGDTIPTTLFTQEVFGSGNTGFRNMINSFKARADKGNRWFKFLYDTYTAPMDAYGNIDQAFKLGVTLKMVNKGINARELTTIRRVVDVPDEMITKVNADLFKIDPAKAVEIAQETFMNYSAMPGAVKVLRSLPLFGSPFASFMYGMTVKTGKTALYNPQVFNKINFAVKEIQGEKTPLEKVALEQPYYEWYKRDGFIRLPFFKENPVYVNMANMIPYYTMNIFEPSERSYKEKLPNSIVSLIDRSPLLKTPEGQVLFDYFIQPLMLRESNPVNMFNQPLYPRDASLGEKAFLAGRQLAEAPVPGIAGLAGLAVPEKAAWLLPSYRARQLSEAKAGKSVLGIPSKEDPFQRTMRVLASTFGLPFYRVETSYTQGGIDDYLKNNK